MVLELQAVLAPTLFGASLAMFLFCLAMPKLIEIERYKSLKEQIMLKYYEKVSSSNMEKIKDNEKMTFIKEELYPLTAFVAMFDNTLEHWRYSKKFTCTLFGMTTLGFLGTILLPLGSNFTIPSSLISLSLWEFGIIFLVFSIFYLLSSLTNREQFLNDVEKIELNKKSIDSFLEEIKISYRKRLKEKKLI